MKKSFIPHNDSLDILDELTDEQAGKLFKAIRNFNIGIELSLDVEIKMLFLHFKNQFIRDCLKYQEKSIINAASGSKGGLAKVANATKRKRTLKSVATLADKDSDTDNEKDLKVSKHSFTKDPLFIKENFKAAFPDWQPEKRGYYYAAVLAWSNEGNKKVDWKATIRTWAARDEKQGKIKFNVVNHTSQLPNAIV